MPPIWRKRFASLRRSTSYVDWRKLKAFVKDLTGLVAMIETGVAPLDADEAFDLLWSFLQLAPSIRARTDDSNGAVGDVLRSAVELLATISPRLTINPAMLAERILDALAEAGYGEFDGIIPALAEALEAEGFHHLKQITGAWGAASSTPQEIAHYRQFGLSTSPVDRARRQRQSTASIILADIADLQGDVDAYMARYSAEQLTYGTIAPDAARRLIDTGRLDEALGIIQRARAAEDGKSFRASQFELDDVYEDCLQKMGKLDALKAHLWTTFQQTLYAGSLRKYLKMLPDFDDMEAEKQARSHAETHAHLGAAIHFLLAWPNLRRLAKLVISRADDLDGNSYETLTAAADALEPEHPIAAPLLRRAMITDTLDGSKTKRYPHAARQLSECQSCAALVGDFGNFQDHGQFLAMLKQKHGRKYGFWEMVDG